jgi:hypothetical protein
MKETGKHWQTQQFENTIHLAPDCYGEAENKNSYGNVKEYFRQVEFNACPTICSVLHSHPMSEKLFKTLVYELFSMGF